MQAFVFQNWQGIRYQLCDPTTSSSQHWSEVPVINMECDKFHPCQALADIVTMREKIGNLKGKKLTISWAYSGSRHKPLAVPHSVLLAASKMGMDITVAHPRGFELHKDICALANKYSSESKSTTNFTNDLVEGTSGADVIYAKSWCSLKYLPKDQSDIVDEVAMNRIFDSNKDWIINDKIIPLVAPFASYMHCLPVDRGQEVSNEVIERSNSIVFSQAANRLNAQNAVMLELLNPGGIDGF